MTADQITDEEIIEVVQTQWTDYLSSDNWWIGINRDDISIQIVVGFNDGLIKCFSTYEITDTEWRAIGVGPFSRMVYLNLRMGRTIRKVERRVQEYRESMR